MLSVVQTRHIANMPKFKDGMFWVCRNDTDLLVISRKYVNELRELPAAFSQQQRSR